ncbi:MAG: cupin domain-containing protein [Nitrososphaerota archaeon]
MNAVIKNLEECIEFPKEGILSKVIMKVKGIQCTLFCMSKGTEISEHTSLKNASLIVLKGKGLMSVAGEETILKPSVFIHMPANTSHALKADDDLAFLLILTE